MTPLRIPTTLAAAVALAVAADAQSPVRKMSWVALPLVAGANYLAFKIRFGNPSTGCGECEHGACIVLNELRFTHDGGQITGTQMDYTNYCSWQSGVYDCPFIVPSVVSSWGKVKDAYR